MNEVVCWCCNHFKPKFNENASKNIMTGGYCKKFNTVCSPNGLVCEEFLLLSGLYTSRQIPEQCKYYKNNQPLLTPEETDISKANMIYDTLVKVFVKNDWICNKEEEKLRIKSVIKTTKRFVGFVVSVNPKKQLVQFISDLFIPAPEVKFSEISIAVCAANNNITQGHFDYNIYDHMISFRLTASFYDSYLEGSLFEQMILNLVEVVDNYRSRFESMIKEDTTLLEFLDEEYMYIL